MQKRQVKKTIDRNGSGPKNKKKKYLHKQTELTSNAANNKKRWNYKTFEMWRYIGGCVCVFWLRSHIVRGFKSVL